MVKYDYLIVGAGLYGSIFANESRKRGYRCLVVDKRKHIGGNCYTQNINGINVHKYGAHIFHTSKEKVWNYLNSYVRFNHYINSPVANFNGKLYNLPFNMNTFYQLWGVTTPLEAKKKIEEQKSEFSHIKEPKNLEEQALVLGGRDIYEKLIKGYSEKQWGRSAIDIPAFIIKRLPFRFTFDNNYFNDPYQGVVVGGYTSLFEKLLEGVEVKLNTDYFTERNELEQLAEKIVYTGPIDQFFEYKFGPLEYRSLRFEQELLQEVDNYQGNAVINYTESEVPYTRIIEHKHFEFGQQAGTVITKEYPSDWKVGDEPYYPINDVINNKKYSEYSNLGNNIPNVIFGGRLGTYKYYNMDQVVDEVLSFFDNKFNS